MGYRAAVDLGTTFTAAAVLRDGRAEMVNLGSSGFSVPSVISLRSDGGYVFGEAAVSHVLTEPHRVAREFKRRLGDPAPIMLGGTSLPAHLLSARFLAWAVDTISERQGGAPDEIVLTHPATWGPYKLDYLDQAVDAADIGAVTKLTEPEAAAIHYADTERLPDGATVLVYDLGGGTFDVAILRRDGDAFSFIGPARGVENLGGIDLDQVLFELLVDGAGVDDEALQDPANAAAVAQLRASAVTAKIALSSDTETSAPVLIAGATTPVRVTRSEFEERISPTLDETVAALRRCLRDADLTADHLDRVLLVGGSSRVPLIGRVLQQELGRPVAVDVDPKNAVALGAARFTHADAGPSDRQPAEAEPMPVVVPPPVDPVEAQPSPTPVVPPPMAEPHPTPAPTSGDTTPKVSRRAVLGGIVGAGAGIVAIGFGTGVLRSSGDDRSAFDASFPFPDGFTARYSAVSLDRIGLSQPGDSASSTAERTEVFDVEGTYSTEELALGSVGIFTTTQGIGANDSGFFVSEDLFARDDEGTAPIFGLVGPGLTGFEGDALGVNISEWVNSPEVCLGIGTDVVAVRRGTPPTTEATDLQPLITWRSSGSRILRFEPGDSGGTTNVVVLDLATLEERPPVLLDTSRSLGDGSGEDLTVADFDEDRVVVSAMGELTTVDLSTGQVDSLGGGTLDQSVLASFRGDVYVGGSDELVRISDLARIEQWSVEFPTGLFVIDEAMWVVDRNGVHRIDPRP